MKKDIENLKNQIKDSNNYLVGIKNIIKNIHLTINNNNQIKPYKKRNNYD